MSQYANIKDAFLHCDVDKLILEYCKIPDGESSKVTIERASAEVHAAMERIKQTQPEKAEKQNLLIVCKTFEENETDTFCVEADDIAEWKKRRASKSEQPEEIGDEMLTFKSYNVFGELIGNGDLNTATDGYYEYNCLEPGIYYVVFDNTYDCYGQTLINQGNDDTLDSEAQPNISLDRSHMYCAWIGDIELPVNTKTEYNVLSKHNDAGFIRLLTSFDLKKVEDLSGIPFENVKFDYEIYSKAENFGKSVFPDDRHQGAPQIYEGAEDSGKSVFSDDSNELYTTASIETFAQAEHLITDKDGLIHFTNQDIATYHLTETKTLPGYVRDGLRPDTVSVKLKGNDKFIDSSELNEDVKWKHSFTKLPVRENGNEITYTAEENEIPGYTTSIEKTDTGYVFTNTHIPETVTVTVDKVWKDAENQDGLRPDAIQIRLISNDIEKDAYLDAESDWHLDFEGLPKYRDHGILNEYSVQEVDVDGYTSTVTTEDGYTFTIENDHVPAVIDIPITEEWIDDNDRDGLRPDSHTVVLVDGTNAIEEVVLDRDNGYGVVLKNMPKYKNGVEINYQIKDFKVDGYTTNIIKSDSVKDFNITNTHVPEMVTITVTEGWYDQSDYDKIRPEKVTLTLTGSDGNVYEKTVTKDTWTTAFSDLPKNSKGEQIIYTLTQEGIKGYKTTITDNETGTIAVINTHEPVKTITVTVTWNDENNKDNIRPDKVTVKLANGTTAVSTKEINNDSWKHIFEDISVFNGSDKVSYTVTQDAVNGYTTEVKVSDDGNTVKIINTHVPVAPPKEEPKQEETVTPAAPAPVVEIKTEPTTTVIETPNKQTGISFMDGLFG